MGDLAAPNSWLRRLGSTTHLKDFSDRKQYLRSLASLKYTIKPDDPIAKDDAELRHIHAANVLFKVNQKELHKERSTPFHFRFKRQTRKKYLAVCLQFFAYAIRAISCEDASDRPPFKLTKSQDTTFDMIIDHAAELVDIDNKVEPVPTSSRITKLHQQLKDAALTFYISILNYFTKVTKYDSILVSFLTILSIRDNKMWETFANFTPKLSAIMAISWVFLIKYTVNKKALYVQQRADQGQTRQEAKDKSLDHFEIISEMTRRFLVGGAEGWDTTPTQFIIRLRNYGMAASGQQAMPGSVSWDNKNATYKGIHVSVLGIQSILQTALQRAEALLYKNTANSGIRNILYDRSLIMLVAGYHKGFSKTKRLKIIHRFLPREVSALVIYYLWLVLPFWEDAPEETLEDLNEDDGKSGYGTGSEQSDGEDMHDRPRHQAESKVRYLGPGLHWTYLLIAITRRYFRNGTTAHASLIGEADEGYGSDSDSDVEQDSIWDAQACHGSLTAGLVYGRLITEGCFETNERRVNFWFISEEWHRLLGFPSAINGFGELLTPGRKRKTPSLHYKAMRTLQLRRWKTLRQINLDQELYRLYGEYVRFRGKQREAVEAIMMNKSPIVVVMGTGTGKSLCFMLPAASCGDMMDRYQKLKISCAEWRGDRLPGDVSILFVTPESAMTKRFLDFLESRRIMAKVDRVVVDKCHTIMEGSLLFRPKSRELGTLSLIGVQMVYLTATLLPSDELAFLSLINACKEDVVMVRARTTCSNVAYSVRLVPALSANKAITAVIEKARVIIDQKLEEYPWPAKIIVYCQCDAYHREIDTQDRKAERLKFWMSGTRREQYGDGRVIVATNALGLGIDVPDIRAVIHVEMPHTMADYAQQSGRAGRDGQRSEAIVIRLDAQGSSRRPLPLISKHAAVDSYISGDHQVDEDNREDKGDVVEDKEESDMRQRELEVGSARHRVMTGIAKEYQEFQDYRRKLVDQVLDGCIFCTVLKSDDNRAHSGLQCEKVVTAGRQIAEAYELAVSMGKFMRQSRVTEDFGCYLSYFVP
ncbi:hypothetical protein F53441_7480 [Fusarium austroafricanum]|uniref:DNA 3'-5' helicase n=1 Tax=Fusarium austroafricanum TaxID=2364996 RepID=A0A8H4NS54_9HYPO|nr:hypothetical protein F53441_7480 [Fusarium austroafricanum]